MLEDKTAAIIEPVARISTITSFSQDIENNDSLIECDFIAPN
jgi:hypothetical protein